MAVKDRGHTGTGKSSALFQVPLLEEYETSPCVCVYFLVMADDFN